VKAKRHKLQVKRKKKDRELKDLEFRIDKIERVLAKKRRQARCAALRASRWREEESFKLIFSRR